MHSEVAQKDRCHKRQTKIKSSSILCQYSSRSFLPQLQSAFCLIHQPACPHFRVESQTTYMEGGSEAEQLCRGALRRYHQRQLFVVLVLITRCVGRRCRRRRGGGRRGRGSGLCGCATSRDDSGRRLEQVGGRAMEATGQEDGVELDAQHALCSEGDDFSREFGAAAVPP